MRPSVVVVCALCAITASACASTQIQPDLVNARDAAERQDYKAAIADLSSAIAKDPGSAQLHGWRARAYLAEGQYKQAAADFSVEIEKNPENPDLYTQRALAYMQDGQFNQGIDDLGKAIDLEPDSANFRMLRARAYIIAGEFHRALADAHEAVRLAPGSASSYSERGFAESNLDQFDEARADYDKALKLDPGDAITYARRGWLNGMQNRWAAARRDFEAAKTDQPNLPYGYAALAWMMATCPDAQYRNGKSAVENATRACELTSWKMPYALAALGAAYAESGDFKSAIKWQQQALDNTPSFVPDFAAHQKTILAGYQSNKPYRDSFLDMQWAIRYTYYVRS